MSIKKAHHTADEINFIRTIGTHYTNKPMPSKKTLLTNYIAAIEKRVNWIGMDKNAITTEAYQQLSLC